MNHGVASPHQENLVAVRRAVVVSVELISGPFPVEAIAEGEVELIGGIRYGAYPPVVITELAFVSQWKLAIQAVPAVQVVPAALVLRTDLPF